MTIIFTNHAKLRQKQRNVSSQEILKTLKHPDISSEDVQGNPLVGKKFNRHALIVVYKKAKEKRIIVITVYKTNSNRLKKIKPVIKGKL